MTREEMIAGLKAGRVLVIDRRDSPLLDDLLALQNEGMVTSEFVQYGEQSSAIKWRWIGAARKEVADHD